MRREIITFKENDRVTVVAGSSNYKGKYSGRTGTVKYVYEQKRSDSNIAVALDDICNDASSKGWFYFRENDLRGDYSFFSRKEREIAEMQRMSICAEAIKAMEELALELSAFENEGDNENMKSEKILDLWKHAGMEHLGEEASIEHEVIMSADQTCAQIRNCVAEIDRVISESGNNEIRFSSNFNYERFVSEATRQKIAMARDNVMAKKKDLNGLTEEITAMLSACDTYEQEMDVLRTYDVIDEDGRLNKTFNLQT